ncbi:BPSS1996 family virulence factor [Burkholderia pseudomallei]|uniref:BPSS1996 family virulence factor n=1 Tax=Burkholderia pseudomallei TaxID=28450 RepID=UPI00155FC4D2|nr:BPSS1996 family virulence factor [Burkholderia pseudomallei]
MKATFLTVALAAAFVSPAAFADAPAGKTRAQVYQELVEAKANGLDYVTDASYPEISPLYAPLYAPRFANKAKPQQPAHAVADTRSDAKAGSSGNLSEAAQDEHCVGPRTFCNPYAGS